MAHFSAKDARVLLARTGARTVADRKCIICGGPLPMDRQKYCSPECSTKRWSKCKPKGKSSSVKGFKINHCRYCNTRADSIDNKRTYTDSAQVKWFRCHCTPTEAQLFNIADMEVEDG